MIGLGGSSTNDGGSGLLEALGLALFDAAERPVEPTPDGLRALARVDAGALDARIAQCHIRIMSDVNNPLTGTLGATAIFGPQKGVRAADIAPYDALLSRFATLAEGALGRTAAHGPGAGAAGGLGFALALLGGSFSSGAEVVASLIASTPRSPTRTGRSPARAAATGRRCSPRRHLWSRSRRAARKVPVTLISGGIDPAALDALRSHFAGCFGLPHGPADLPDCMANAAQLLEERAEQVGRVFAAGHGARSRAVE